MEKQQVPPLFSGGFQHTIELIRREIAEEGYSVVRPPGFEALCESARGEFTEALGKLRLQPPKKAFHYSDLGTSPWRKLAIGSTNGVGEAYAQFLQTVYFDCAHGEETYPSLNSLFRTLIELRNQLMAVKPDFGNNPEQDGFWNACRVHHYPSGGSFMVMHRDTYFPAQLGEHAFYQVLVPLSKKGRDFHSGGGFIVDKSGRKIDTDKTIGMGGILVFDGRIQHGVEDVDPESVISFESVAGRLAAVCNLYVTR